MQVGADGYGDAAIPPLYGMAERQVVGATGGEEHREGQRPGPVFDGLQALGQAGFKPLIGAARIQGVGPLQTTQPVGRDGQVGEQIKGPATAVLPLHLRGEGADEQHFLAS